VIVPAADLPTVIGTGARLFPSPDDAAHLTCTLAEQAGPAVLTVHETVR